ncbi:MAG TPA: ABC transporter substrate-binding protein [Acetobacteraceae bacterium]|nr:ABC transporter substrate-binding protein [Acetobacteraceae bacterium]
MRIICSGLAAIACLIGADCVAETQTLTLMRGIDPPHYDAQRTTSWPVADIVNMIQDTLVALDWDGRTPIPYLAKSWQISPDGRTYTFKLRDDVTFCSGKKFTAEDVVYTFKRLLDPATRSPFAWRAGKIKELRAPDPYTVEYELQEPYNSLLLQLTMFSNVIINQESVEQLGKDYGINGADGTGPWCFVSWQPRNETVLRRHDAYHWGPTMYRNPGPVHFDRLVLKIVPEDLSRVTAMMAGTFDYTDHFPYPYIDQAMAAPMLQVQKVKPNFSLVYFGFKTTREMVSDRRVRQAMNIAINRAEIVKGVMLGHAEPSYTYVHPDALDYDPKTADMIKEDVALANRLLDEAGWKLGSDGIREKNGVKLAPKVYVPVATNPARVAEPIQGFMRRIGIDWRITAWDNTIYVAKIAEQDYDIWSAGQPYLSAGELMEFCFDSHNIPVPNRSNWNDAETDAWLHAGSTALRDDERARNYALVQQKVTAEHLIMPVLNLPQYEVTNMRLKGARPHMLYSHTFYKGLDLYK